jgi:hypothetical protein
VREIRGHRPSLDPLLEQVADPVNDIAAAVFCGPAAFTQRPGRGRKRRLGDSPFGTGASALFSTLRQAGTTLGVALMSTAMITTRSHTAGPAGMLTPYRAAFFTAAALALADAMMAFTIRDHAAAATIQPPEQAQSTTADREPSARR